jgi:antitoxin ParD1/3/4
MKVEIGGRWKAVIDAAVESGRYASAEDVVTEALARLAGAEARHAELVASIEAALAEAEEVSEAELDASLAAVDEELRAQGYR